MPVLFYPDQRKSVKLSIDFSGVEFLSKLLQTNYEL